MGYSSVFTLAFSISLPSPFLPTPSSLARSSSSSSPMNQSQIHESCWPVSTSYSMRHRLTLTPRLARSSTGFYYNQGPVVAPLPAYPIAPIPIITQPGPILAPYLPPRADTYHTTPVIHPLGLPRAYTPVSHHPGLPSVPYPSPPSLPHFNSAQAFQLQPRAQTPPAPISWHQQQTPQIVRRGTYPDHNLRVSSSHPGQNPRSDHLGLWLEPRSSSRQSSRSRDQHEKKVYPATPRYRPATLEEETRPRRRSLDGTHRLVPREQHDYQPRQTASRSDEQAGVYQQQQQPPSSRRHRSHTLGRVPQHHSDR